MGKKCWIIGVVLVIALYTGLAMADGRPDVKRPEPPLRELLMRAGRIVVQSGDAEAIQLLKEARRLVGELRLAAQAGDRARVRRIERRVRELLHRAIRIVGAPEHAPRALDKLDEVLSRADEVVGGNTEAEELLSKAHDLSKEAKQAVDSEAYPKAMRLIHQAMGLAQRSIFMVRGPEIAEEAVKRLGMLLDRAEDVLAAHPDEKASDLLEKARELQSKATEALDKGEHRKALMIARKASELARKGIKIARAPEEAEKALGGLRELLERADGIVEGSGKPRAERALSKAHALEQRASEAVGEEAYLRALEWIRKAAGLAEGAILTVDGPGEVQRIAEKLDGLLSEANGSVPESGNEKALKLLEKAQALRETGAKAAEDERYHRAFGIMRQAVHLVSQAIRMIEDRGEGEPEETSKLAANMAPKILSLSQNFPNPFNAETAITYALPNPGEVTLTVYNTLGQKIRTLIHETQEVGTHTVSWDSRDAQGRVVAGGIYLYRVEMGDEAITKQMILLK